MRAALLGDTLQAPLTGIGHYTVNLHRELNATGTPTTMLCHPSGRFVRPAGPVAVAPPRKARSAKAETLLWEVLDVSRLARSGGYDLVHSPGSLRAAAALRSRLPLVATIHDLTPLTHPGTHVARRRAEFRLLLGRVLRRAAAVVVDSQSAAEDLERHAPYLRRRILRSVPLGVDLERFRPATGPRTADPSAGPAEPYFLCVGSLQPRKNLARILEAFAVRVRQGGPERLLLVGPEGWKSGQLAERVGALGIQDRVTSTGYVDDAALAKLYQGATALAYPSLYEGFGLPILEAMASGCPVVTSTTSSMPEVAGGAALLVDPTDVGAIAAAMAEAAEPAVRRRLVDAGLRRASAMSWRHTAERTRAVYDEVMQAAR